MLLKSLSCCCCCCLLLLQLLLLSVCDLDAWSLDCLFHLPANHLPPCCSTNSKYPAPPYPHPYSFRDEFPLYIFLSSTRIGSYSINILEISICNFTFLLRYRSNFTFHICYIQTNYRQITDTHTCGRCVCACVCVGVHKYRYIIYNKANMTRVKSQEVVCVCVWKPVNFRIVCVFVFMKKKETDNRVYLCECVCEGDKSLLENTKFKYLTFKFKSFTSQIVCYSS